MDKNREKNLRWIAAGIVVMFLLVGVASVFQNTGNSPGKNSSPSADPETGVRMWIDAVNQRNIERIYNLTPDEIKQQITITRFTENNVNNTLFQSGYDPAGYRILDKQQNRTFARIVAEVPYRGNHPGPGIKAPLVYVFDLFYEHGEWKVWTDAETGLQMWIAAVDARDVDRVYDLSPDALKAQISPDQFRKENANNSFLREGTFNRNYILVDKQQNATISQIVAALTFNQSVDQGNATAMVPITYRFGLFYEHGEWKILTLNL